MRNNVAFVAFLRWCINADMYGIVLYTVFGVFEKIRGFELNVDVETFYCTALHIIRFDSPVGPTEH